MWSRFSFGNIKKKAGRVKVGTAIWGSFWFQGLGFIVSGFRASGLWCSGLWFRVYLLIFMIVQFKVLGLGF